MNILTCLSAHTCTVAAAQSTAQHVSNFPYTRVFCRFNALLWREDVVLFAILSVALTIVTALLSPRQPARLHPQKGFVLAFIDSLSLSFGCLLTYIRRSIESIMATHMSIGLWPLSEWLTAKFITLHPIINFINTPRHHPCPASSRPAMLIVFPRTQPHDACTDWRFNNTKRFTAPTHLPL